VLLAERMETSRSVNKTEFSRHAWERIFDAPTRDKESIETSLPDISNSTGRASSFKPSRPTRRKDCDLGRNENILHGRHS
jgi:hypothetical protein